MIRLSNPNSRFQFWKRKKAIGNICLALIFVFFIYYANFVRHSDTQFAAATQATGQLSAGKLQKIAVVTTARMAEDFHYTKRPLNNEFSELILHQYLHALDPQKIYLLESDINQFESNRYYFDNFLNEGNLDEVFLIFKRFQERIQERTDYAKSLLDYPFDFEIVDELQIDRSTVDWLNNQEEYDSLWRKLVKDDILTLKLNDNDSKTIQETLNSRYERLQQSVSLYNSDDVIEIFLNSYLQELDPHSEYFSPHSTDNLEISISQQFEGIGAMLKSENEQITVQSVITGGPASRGNKLHAGDRIVAVRSRANQNYQEIIGWRLEDVVDLIRGPKGTTVFLKIIPKDAMSGTAPKEIAITREQVKLEEQMAKKSTVELEIDGRILQLGVISLPAFYSELFRQDEGEAEFPRSSARDVLKLLQELNEQHVDGIVMDLRGNGGGALHEAVSLTSLFLKSGPIVQVEKSQGDLEIKSDSDNVVVYGGPLVVLVDRRSASASEIFASAIQDYRRGIVVGETTYGKGMLQTIWPLSRILNIDVSGTLKLSTAQFYRVNGSSTQHLGVVPDVLFATNEFVANTGERALKNALPSGVINPAGSVVRWRNANFIENRIPEIRRLNKERSRFNPAVEYIVARERLNLDRIDQKVVYLNEDQRRKSLDSDREAQLNNLNQLRSSLGLSPATDLTEDAFPSQRVGDVFLDQALSVLADLITIKLSDMQQAQTIQ